MGQTNSVSNTDINKKLLNTEDDIIIRDVISESDYQFINNTVTNMDSLSTDEEDKILQSMLEENLTDKVENLKKCIEEFCDKK